MQNGESAVDVPRGGAWFTLILFLLLYMCSMLDRNIINVLVIPIRQELGIGDFEVGLLLGPAFGLAYVVMAYPMAWLADRWSRRGVVFLGSIVWSLSNCAAGLTHSFEALFVTRFGVGLGEAALVPAAYVLIAQMFPRRSLALAMSIFSIGSIGGMAVSFGLGGWLLDTLHSGMDLPVAGHLSAWRLVFVLTGLPSLLLGLLLYFVPERRQSASAQAADRAVSLLQFLRAHPWPAIGIPMAFGMASLCASAVVAWVPTFAISRFGWSATAIGAVMAAMLAVVGSIGKIGSGVFVDRIFARGMKDAHPRYLLVGLVIATPPTILAFNAGPTVFVVCLAFWFLLVQPLQGYGAAAIQIITPEALRGRMSSLFIVLANLMATAGAPITGYLSEHAFAGPAALGQSLSATIAIWAPLTILLLWRLLPETRRLVGLREAGMGTISGQQ